MRKIFNLFGTQVGWFACAFGAANGMPWLGVAVVTCYLVVHLWLSTQRARELKFMLTAAALGMTVDSAQKALGLVSYASDTLALAWLAPWWLGALWLQFASTFTAALTWLQGRYLLAALLGAIFGPLSYASGAALGALSFADRTVSLSVLVVVWGALTPLLAWLAKKMVG